MIDLIKTLTIVFYSSVAILLTIVSIAVIIHDNCDNPKINTIVKKIVTIMMSISILFGVSVIIISLWQLSSMY